MLLATVMLLPLMGCGSSGFQTSQPTMTTTTVLPGTPTQAPTAFETAGSTIPTVPTTLETLPATQPEIADYTYIKAKLADYFEIVRKLDQYTPGDILHVSTGDRSKSYSGNEALRYCYETLLELEAMDPWLNEESWNRIMAGYSLINLDRASYLARLAVAENVLLHMNYEEIYGGSSAQKERVVWHYNADGRVYYIYNGVEHLEQYRTYRRIAPSHILFRYDENGIVSNACFGQKHALVSYLTPIYDASGRVITEIYTHAVYTHRIEYSYDEAGRMTKKVLYEDVSTEDPQYPWPGDGYYWITEFTYDDAGKLLQEVETGYFHNSQEGFEWAWSVVTTQYQYSSDGVLESAVRTSRSGHPNDIHFQWSESVENYAYTYDDQGRLLTRTVTGDSRGWVEEYIYGDYYAFGEFEVNLPEIEK